MPYSVCPFAVVWQVMRGTKSPFAVHTQLWSSKYGFNVSNTVLALVGSFATDYMYAYFKNMDSASDLSSSIGLALKYFEIQQSSSDSNIRKVRCKSINQFLFYSQGWYFTAQHWTQWVMINCVALNSSSVKRKGRSDVQNTSIFLQICFLSGKIEVMYCFADILTGKIIQSHSSVPILGGYFPVNFCEKQKENKKANLAAFHL